MGETGRVALKGPGIAGLLQDSEKVGRELTQEFYAEYAFIRRSTFARLRASNPSIEPRLVLASAQKLLDRVLFVAFCEDRGLLPLETIKRAYSHRDPYTPRPLWDNFRGMFRAINEGRSELNIHKYNGGLFADDPVLDNLSAPDDVFQWFRDLAEYDFRSASELAADGSLADTRFIDVEILGHIFEQSIDDLEELRKEMNKPPGGNSDHPRRRGRQAESQPAQTGGGLLYTILHHPVYHRTSSGRSLTRSVRPPPPSPYGQGHGHGPERDERPVGLRSRIP